jgi:sugar lactone lactonase YvrE
VIEEFNMTDFSSSKRLLATGFAMGESPRWHNGKLWSSDWGAQEIIALDSGGARATTLSVPFALPFCFDWDTHGRLLVVAGREARLMRHVHDSTFAEFADLGTISSTPWNEIVVDGRGNAYINSSEAIALLSPGGSIRQVAEGGRFPNGMAVTADNRTLLLAESHGKCLTAFDIASDGGLSNRRTWADLDGPPDGVCVDLEGAVWYADVPNKRCVRVREGGAILDSVDLYRGCFSCVLGGNDGRTLFVVATEWRGMDKIAEVAAACTCQVVTFTAPAPAVGHRAP